MSSTGRSGAREEHEHDYYVTPHWMIRDFLTAFEKDTEAVSQLAETGETILDPSAGGDAKNEMSYPAVLKEFGIHAETMDIRGDSPADIHGDYLEAKLERAPQLIITNPPFNLAMEFIEKALDDVEDGGLVVMLLRLNYFGTQKRQLFWQERMPMLTYVHSKRPGFDPARPGKTDSTEYMHAVWQKGTYPYLTNLRVI